MMTTKLLCEMVASRISRAMAFAAISCQQCLFLAQLAANLLGFLHIDCEMRVCLLIIMGLSIFINTPPAHHQHHLH